MAQQTVDTPTGQATVDLEKYTELVLKVDEAQDKIKEMESLSKELKVATAVAKPVHKGFLSIFRDENNINEKSIIGFASFLMMVAFGVVDLITGLDGTPLEISDTIYTLPSLL